MTHSDAEILIVDDHAAIRDGIRLLLDARPQWHVCGEAIDGVDAVEKVHGLQPDIVLMDVSMPRMDGLTATRIIRRESPRSHVIIVTQNDAFSQLREGVGADGYVLKVDLHRDLVRTIELVLSAARREAGTGHDGSADAGPHDASAADARSGALLAAIIDSSDDAIISKDLDGVVTSWNHGAERLFGYTAAEMLGQPIMRITPLDRRDEEQSILARVRSGQRVPAFETVRVRKDGTLVECSVTVSPVCNPDGEVVGASNLSRDITEQKRAQRNAALLAAIVDSSDDAILSTNLSGTVMSWNRGAERLFGYSAHEMLGKPLIRTIPRERHAEEEEIFQRLRGGEHVDHFETVRIRKDGSLVDVSVTASPLRDAQGRVFGASKVARDITERKRDEEHLRALAGDLEITVLQRTRELERRNAEILEQSERLQELSTRLQQGQDAERRRIARELHDSAGQLLAMLQLNLGHVRERLHPNEAAVKVIAHSEELVDQLNSEIRTMSYLLHPPLLDENGLCGAIRWYAKGLSERAGFEAEVDVPEDFGRLPGDLELALFRIVQECLTNIHKHSGSKTAFIRLRCENGEVHLEVRDEGKGIAPDQLSGLGRHRTGVGITGMRERVRQFNGHMHIESGSGGTTVSVAIPVPGNFSCDSIA